MIRPSLLPMNTSRSVPILCPAITAAIQPLPALGAEGPSGRDRQSRATEQINLSEGHELSLFAAEDQIYSPSGIELGK